MKIAPIKINRTISTRLVHQLSSQNVLMAWQYFIKDIGEQTCHTKEEPLGSMTLIINILADS